MNDGRVRAARGRERVPSLTRECVRTVRRLRIRVRVKDERRKQVHSLTHIVQTVEVGAFRYQKLDCIRFVRLTCQVQGGAAVL